MRKRNIDVRTKNEEEERKVKDIKEENWNKNGKRLKNK